MKYGLIQYSSPQDVVKKVNEAIKKGWEPIGGCSWQGRSYVQAIVHDGMDPDEKDDKE